MAHLLLIFISVLAIGTYSEARCKRNNNIYRVQSTWTSNPQSRSNPIEKCDLICDISEKQDASVYWMKNQELKGNGTHLEITVREPLDAGNYTCWNRNTNELLSYATVLITKKEENGAIADPMLTDLEKPNEIYFKCTANNHSGNFTCFWEPDGQNSDLKFTISGDTSGNITCEEPVKNSVGLNLETYSVSCRKEKSCLATEEFKPIMMFLDVLYGFIYEQHIHTFFLKDIIKPDPSECQITKSGLLTWTPPKTWSEPVTYYGLTFQIETVRHRRSREAARSICEIVDSTTSKTNGNTLSCNVKLNKDERYRIRSRDFYNNKDSAWSDWSEPCRDESHKNDKPYHIQNRIITKPYRTQEDNKAKILPCDCQKN